ncbi:MAG: ATP-binding cassette domain-containing protein [Desulfobacterota bacterium]|jgi:NitT/TauT family transport system ATP-binding protein|nr:ATP-binding cassette domain-containing protein [Thermodesulfobacteriota bacterium]
MIAVEAITFQYSPGPVFEDFSWRVQRGDTWAVLGPSGCGKSTLLALLAGLLLPSSGRVRIDGAALLRPRPQTGLILQDYGLLPWATVRQNAGLGLKVRRFYGADGIHAPRDPVPGRSVDFWLDRLGLVPVADQYPAQLSGGQRQRTAIARTLLLQPDLLLMDEPFSSLDTPTREALQVLTMELAAEQNLTLVLVTHALEEAALLGRKILLLHEPPNRLADLVDNPGAGNPAYRESRAYAGLCQDLRRRLEMIPVRPR